MFLILQKKSKYNMEISSVKDETSILLRMLFEMVNNSTLKITLVIFVMVI